MIFFISCGKNNTPDNHAFYYWKTTFTLSEFEKQSLSHFEVNKLYVRLFDVDWDPSLGDIIPVAEISFADTLPNNIEIVPTVYLTNRSLGNVASQTIHDAARKIIQQVEGICKKNNISFSEVQLDCDWTEGTREKYFTLLNNLKDYLHQRHKTISATIRLHQVKYYERTGVPPVDRGMLMYYNMGKLDAKQLRNSIYNKQDADLYINAIGTYKLPLDIALPVFSMIIQIREQQIIELINKSYLRDIMTDGRFKKYSDETYIVQESFFLHGSYFMKNDILKIENVPATNLLEAAQSLSKHLPDEKRTVALFDLDSLNLRNYNEKDIQQVFSYFR